MREIKEEGLANDSASPQNVTPQGQSREETGGAFDFEFAPTFNAEGYPTEETLTVIRSWPAERYDRLLALVRAAWRYPDYFYQEGMMYKISTGGWSGHEDIISALEQNVIFWSLSWEQSKRGGHYLFLIPECCLSPDVASPAATRVPGEADSPLSPDITNTKEEN